MVWKKKKRFTYHPFSPKGLDFLLGHIAVLSYEAFSDGVPVPREVFPPALQRLDVVRTNALDSLNFEVALGPIVN
jgi:hypothetical protein